MQTLQDCRRPEIWTVPFIYNGNARLMSGQHLSYSSSSIFYYLVAWWPRKIWKQAKLYFVKKLQFRDQNKDVFLYASRVIPVWRTSKKLISSGVADAIFLSVKRDVPRLSIRLAHYIFIAHISLFIINRLGPWPWSRMCCFESSENPHDDQGYDSISSGLSMYFSTKGFVTQDHSTKIIRGNDWNWRTVIEINEYLTFDNKVKLTRVLVDCNTTTNCDAKQICGASIKSTWSTSSEMFVDSPINLVKKKFTQLAAPSTSMPSKFDFQ